LGRRFAGRVQPGYGLGAPRMSDPVLAERQRHHFTRFSPVPGTLNLWLEEPFDPRLFTALVTSWELGGMPEDHPYAPVWIEGTIPGFVTQTLKPRRRLPGGGRRADRGPSPPNGARSRRR
jgi:hypothetical protein